MESKAVSDSESSSGERSRSRSRSQQRTSDSNDGSGSRSCSADSAKSPLNQTKSESPHSQDSRLSRSRSATPAEISNDHESVIDSQLNAVKPIQSIEGTPKSQRSRSNTPKLSKSRSCSSENVHKNESRSNSPNLHIDEAQNNRSGSESKSSSKNSKSKRFSRSQSEFRSQSRSRSRSRSKSGSDISRTSSITNDKKKRKILSSDSESDNSSKKSRKVQKSDVIDSDSNNDHKTQEGVTADALFGDANDISSDEEGEKKVSVDRKTHHSRSRSDSKSSTDEADKKDSDNESIGQSSKNREEIATGETYFADDNEPDEPEQIPETRIDAIIPRIVTDLGKEIHFVKLPNFLSVETRPFDTETYEDEIDEEETMDEEGRQRIKLKVSNTIRWREYMNDKGEMVKESNARMVKWSDGSMSLHLGNEIFDVYRQPLQGDHNHLFIRQGTGLQGQAVFRTKLTFRPHSTESFTHKKMTMSLADRSQKTSGIKILTQVGTDPTADRQYHLKKEEEKLRQAMRKPAHTKPKRNRSGGETNDSNSGPNALYREHDEGSEDEGGISIAAIKNKFKKNSQVKQGAAIYSSDDDDGSDFETKSKKIDKAKMMKALRDSDEDSDENNHDITHDGTNAKNDGKDLDSQSSEDSTESD